jgi:hypothetical protein
VSGKSKKCISVTEVAGLGICEQQVILDRRYGKARSARLQAKAKRGIRAHSQFDQQVRRISDPRCFIASTLYGPNTHETRCLRGFRDQHLLPYRAGRCLCTLYYRVSPILVPALSRCPRLAALLRAGLNIAVKWIERRPREVADDR